jgi:hypothetical protein
VSGFNASSYVDMYNATSNSWTSYPAGLGQARSYLAAVSLASGLVFFAGGWTGLFVWRARLFDVTLAVCSCVVCEWSASMRSFLMLHHDDFDAVQFKLRDKM